MTGEVLELLLKSLPWLRERVTEPQRRADTRRVVNEGVSTVDFSETE
jgi:hypothetical protein